MYSSIHLPVPIQGTGKLLQAVVAVRLGTFAELLPFVWMSVSHRGLTVGKSRTIVHKNDTVDRYKIRVFVFMRLNHARL
jgi:hypothetical protein